MLLKNHIQFAVQSLRHFHHTGAVVPSSPFLANVMTRALKNRPKGQEPWHILEVGPGTGPMTAQIVRKMRDGDTLECYELNTHFCRHLRERFQKEKIFQRRARQVLILEKDICGLPAGKRYDLIVCGLPFNNFQPDLAQKIMTLLFNSLKPGAGLTFFEYLFLRKAKSVVTDRKERERLAKIEKAVETLSSKGICRNHVVWMNVPPALVRTITRPK